MHFFRNMKLASKISLLSLSFLIFLGIVGAAAIMQISAVHSNVMELNDSRLVPIVKIESIKSDIEYIRAQSNSLMDAGDDDSKKEPIQEDIQARAAAVEEKMAEFKNKTEYQTLMESFNNFIAGKDNFLTVKGVGTGIALNSQQQSTTGAAPEEMLKYDAARKTIIEALNKVVDKQVADAKVTYDNSKTTYRNTKIVVGALIALSSVIIILISIVIIRAIIVPVNNVTRKLKEIANNGGDLTQRISYNSKDEIGQLSSSFDLFAEKLHSIIMEVASSAETIAASTQELRAATGATTQGLEEIANTVVEIASGSSDGASVAEETNDSLVEAAKFSEATLVATRSTNENSKKAKDAAESGEQKISEVVSSITEIAASSKEVSGMISDLDESSKRIGEIIKIITSISEQTNLLALNAAIEAARAGEAGRGFNVVADEIRKLADESNSAAREISELVKDNQFKSAAAVSSVGEVEEKVAIGVNKASEVSTSIQSIIRNIQDIAEQIEQIDDANEKQAESSKEMEKAISSIAAASSQIAGGTENISASIEEQLSTMTEIESTTEQLSDMASRLRDLTSGFKL
jgi:methyl-accepting chemotaxis protein